MSVSIVDLLKVIDIQHHDRAGDPGSDQLLQILHELAAVRQSGQEVMLGCRFHDCTCLLQFLQQLSSAVIIEAHPADNDIECGDKY